MKGIELGQTRPSDTNPVSLVSPDGNESINIKELLVCNTTTSSAKYRIFKDEDGATYDQSTAHFYDVVLPANTTDILEFDLWMNDPAGNLAVRTDTNSALTFTAHGEILER